MKRSTMILLAFVLAAAVAAGAARWHRARADGGGFDFGEVHPCQVCTQAQMADHNQHALQGRG